MGLETSIIMIVCSTGGPEVLRKVLTDLNQELQVPVVIVQHMPKRFTKSLAGSLNKLSSMHVREAKNGEFLKAGNIYIAPGGKHIKILDNLAGHPFFKIYQDVGVLKPCADVLLRSLIQSGFTKIKVVVLTGMGNDGTAGLKALLEDATKELHIIVQKPEECVVGGMPQSVIKEGMADEILSVNEIAHAMMKGMIQGGS